MAVLNPEMNPPFITDALDRMSKRLWFLYSEGGLYRFEAKQNLTEAVELARIAMSLADQSLAGSSHLFQVGAESLGATGHVLKGELVRDQGAPTVRSESDVRQAPFPPIRRMLTA